MAGRWFGPVSPWRKALREERCLPASVRGPVEFRAFTRLVSVLGAEGSVMREIVEGKCEIKKLTR